MADLSKGPRKQRKGFDFAGLGIEDDDKETSPVKEQVSSALRPARLPAYAD